MFSFLNAFMEEMSVGKGAQCFSQLGKYGKLNFQKTLWPLLWMELNCLWATEPVRRDTLLLTTKSPGVH